MASVRPSIIFYLFDLQVVFHQPPLAGMEFPSLASPLVPPCPFRRCLCTFLQTLVLRVSFHYSISLLHALCARGSALRSPLHSIRHCRPRSGLTQRVSMKMVKEKEAISAQPLSHKGKLSENAGKEKEVIAISVPPILE
ncbi:uncharacterized protein LOC120082039 isoform X2 [Benincasa hispida]|uniref:uncharacterized protein LOC120082039 isoform X2 n=1 Tax=Benincasa hispida TaxID=102211 RepID=UPI0018FFC6F6|nr:uncharacterized protein LOC120082039 isoform X2 [Benincasa hispida]